MFSWIGLTVIPNAQIGRLDPQSLEEDTDIYPMPPSGMAERGRQVYNANGCMYCHSRWVRADYAGSDQDRKWGDRRSAPRDYIFERPVLLGKMRTGPDLSNIGQRAPREDENAPPTGSPSPGASAGPATAAASPAAGAPAKQPAPSPAVAAAGSKGAAAASPSPAAAESPPAGAAAKAAAASPAPGAATQAKQPAPSPAVATAGSKGAAAAPASPAPAGSPAAGGSPATAQQPASSSSLGSENKPNEVPVYSAAWHHRHLYSPRTVTLDSIMPAYRFLYEKRPISGQPSADALKLTGVDAPPEGWEIVPTYDARCLVAFLIGSNQSHPLNEAKPAGATGPAPAASPAPAPAASPAAPGK